jgi:methylmalonyl-CoA mutase
MDDALELSEFPAATREEWRRRVERVLKTAKIESLNSRAADGFAIEPLYEPAGGSAIEGRAGGEAWSIVQRMDHPQPGEARDLALEDIDNGATGLALTFSGAPSARGFGLKDCTAQAIGIALRDLPLHRLELRLEAGAQGFKAAEAMREMILALSLNPERMRLSFGLDPIGALAAQGAQERSPREVATIIKRLAEEFTGPLVEADGRVYHDGGASEAQELGSVLATAVSYLRAVEGTIDDAQAGRLIGMTLAADADMFMGIAKFRAARLLWREIAGACVLKDAALRLHGESSWRMMTRRDPHNNLLRNVTAVFAAGLGGADSICALPFSLAAGLPDRFARRMARNVQIILIEEANLHQVGDAAAGSGYVEELTSALAERAWQFFQEIERRGGIAEALKSGFVPERISESRRRRAAEIASGKRTIMGVSGFASEVEQPPATIAAARLNGLATGFIQAKRDAQDLERGR